MRLAPDIHVIANSFEYYRDQEVMDWLMFTCPNNYNNNNKAFKTWPNLDKKSRLDGNSKCKARKKKAL
jgi:hypothetical protein